MHLNATLPLRISYDTISLQRWLLMSHMEVSLDDIRRLISDTSIYLLLMTMIASSLFII